MLTDVSTREAARRGHPEPSLQQGRHWFACSTRSRAEKKVRLHLEGAGIEAYLPLVEQERQWADRRKLVEVPLFPGYVFVLTSLVGISDVLRVSGVVKVADPNGYPTPVRQAELEAVRRLVEGVNESGLLPSPADYLEADQEVVVVEGPFTGMAGVLVEDRGRTRVAVKIAALRQATSVELDRTVLRPAR